MIYAVVDDMGVVYCAYFDIVPALSVLIDLLKVVDNNNTKYELMRIERTEEEWRGSLL